MADEYAARDVNRVTTMLAVDDTAGEIDKLETDPTTKRLKVDSLNEDQGHTAVGTDTFYIKAAGHVQQLSAHTCKRVRITAGSGNTGLLCIGGSSVASTITVRQGVCFYPTQGDWFNVSNTNLLYATSTAAGDGAHIFYEN